MTDEAVVAAYRELASVWKVARRLGLAGQTVYERLRRLGYSTAHQAWTPEELDEVRSLANQGEPLNEIAARLGRTYSSVAVKLSRLGVRSTRPSWRWKPRSDASIPADRLHDYAKKLDGGGLSIWRLARMEGIAVTPLVDAMQRWESQIWQRYIERHSTRAARTCLGCDREFRPLTGKQRYCTVRCREAHRRDLAYFGGKRSQALGLTDNTCQLCRKRVEKWLSAHHVLGKENDPDNNALIALCRGCHDILTRLSARPWVENPDVVADLISMAMARRGRTNAFVSLEVEYWNSAELEDYLEATHAGSD